MCTLSIWPSIKAKDMSRSSLFSPDVRIDMAGTEFWKNQDLICPNEAALTGFDPRGAKGHLSIETIHFSCFLSSTNYHFIVFNVSPFDSTTLAIAKNNARSHLMCITRAAPAWFEWSELFKLFDWVEFCQRLFFEPTARKIILQNSTKSKSLKCKPNSNQAGAALVIHIKWLRALFFKMAKFVE